MFICFTTVYYLFSLFCTWLILNEVWRLSVMLLRVVYVLYSPSHDSIQVFISILLSFLPVSGDSVTEAASVVGQLTDAQVYRICHFHCTSLPWNKTFTCFFFFFFFYNFNLSDNTLFPSSHVQPSLSVQQAISYCWPMVIPLSASVCLISICFNFLSVFSLHWFIHPSILCTTLDNYHCNMEASLMQVLSLSIKYFHLTSIRNMAVCCIHS